MEPKNRQTKSLGVIEIEIHTNNSVLEFDPNLMAYTVGTWDWKNEMTPIDSLKSELSGKPAYFVLIDDLKLALSLSEIDRLFRHDLKPKEQKTLLEKYGHFHEIGSSFYENGRAWQPIPISNEGKQNFLIEEEIRKKEKLKNKIDKKLTVKSESNSKFKI